MAAGQRELVERAQGGEVDAQFLKAATHEPAARAFGETVGEEALQAVEGAASRCLQARLRRIVEHGDREPRGQDLAGPFQLSKAARHRHPARRYWRLAGSNANARLKGVPGASLTAGS